MKKKEIVLVKLGGSVITDKNIPYKARNSVIKRLVLELKKADVPAVLGHGAGSFAHTSAAKYGGMKGYKSKYGIAKVSNDTLSLHKIIMDALLEEKLPAISVRPGNVIITDKGKIKKKFFEIFTELLSQELLPVVCGDVIWDKTYKSTIYSGEKTLNILCSYLSKNGFKTRRIIQVGNTNGVYDDKRKTIEFITAKNWNLVKQFVGASSGTDVTGGMRSKVEDALAMAGRGFETWLVNGLIPGQLKKALKGDRISGTIIK